MDLIADRGRRVSIEELNTTRLLANARKQAHRRNFDDMLIVDVDAHHYENEHLADILPFMENEVLKQLAISGRAKLGRQNLMPTQIGFQDMGGRVTRYPLRASEKTGDGKHARRAARPPLDGRDGRRLRLPVPDRHAQYRAASADRDGVRPVLGVQPMGNREGHPGIRTGASIRCCACRSPIPTSRCATSRPSAIARASAASW